MSFTWYEHICNYHNVTPEQALKLGTRKSGRKPDLPGTDSCIAISNMTYEDIWNSSDRKTAESIFDFYRAQGAWSTFRQCVRHKDLEQLHLSYFNFLMQNNILKNGSHICEYGCGVAPFMTTFLKYFKPEHDTKIKLTLADVDCDHFDFAKYRLNKIVENKKLKDNIELSFETITPDILPTFSNQNVDVLFCFEVLEHVVSPINVINNIKNSMNPGCIYIENFIDHKEEEIEEDGPDLPSAKKERKQYYEILNEYYNLTHPSQDESNSNPNVTRIWQRNSL